MLYVNPFNRNYNTNYSTNQQLTNNSYANSSLTNDSTVTTGQPLGESINLSNFYPNEYTNINSSKHLPQHVHLAAIVKHTNTDTDIITVDKVNPRNVLLNNTNTNTNTDKVDKVNTFDDLLNVFNRAPEATTIKKKPPTNSIGPGRTHNGITYLNPLI